MRRAQSASTASQPRGQIVDGVSIRDRPADVEDRAIPGHWEGDLITGAQNTHLATQVERQSRFTMLVKVPGKDTIGVVTALSAQIQHLPAAWRRSLTWDRGMELAQHKQLTLATKVQVYFCDPQSPRHPNASFRETPKSRPAQTCSRGGCEYGQKLQTRKASHSSGSEA